MKLPRLKQKKALIIASKKTRVTLRSSASSKLNGGRAKARLHSKMEVPATRSSASRRKATPAVSHKITRDLPSVRVSKARKKARGTLTSTMVLPSSSAPRQRAADPGIIALPKTDVRRPASPSAKSTGQQPHSAREKIAPASPPPISETRPTQGPTTSTEYSSAVVSEILVQYRLRQDFVMAQGNLDRQLKKIVSRLTGIVKVSAGDIEEYLEKAPDSAREHLGRIIALRDRARDSRSVYEKALTQLAQRLPVYASFVEPLHGFGAIGLAQIVGEAGAGLEAYSRPCKLWRRFGLHVYEGRAFATWKSQGGLSAETWKVAGYCPHRRSVMYSITDSLLKKKDNRYREPYLAQKAKELAKAQAAGLIVCAAADIPKDAKAGYMSLGHVNARATRWIAKRLLKDLWRAWNPRRTDLPQHSVPPATSDSTGETRQDMRGKRLERLVSPVVLV